MTMRYSYNTQGTCSRRIDITIDGDRVSGIAFEGGCHGNTQGLAALVAGMKVDDVIARLHGIDCRGRGTSCPDQLAKALIKIKEQQCEKS